MGPWLRAIPFGTVASSPSSGRVPQGGSTPHAPPDRSVPYLPFGRCRFDTSLSMVRLRAKIAGSIRRMPRPIRRFAETRLPIAEMPAHGTRDFWGNLPVWVFGVLTDFGHAVFGRVVLVG